MKQKKLGSRINVNTMGSASDGHNECVIESIHPAIEKVFFNLFIFPIILKTLLNFYFILLPNISSKCEPLNITGRQYP